MGRTVEAVRYADDANRLLFVELLGARDAADIGSDTGHAVLDLLAAAYTRLEDRTTFGSQALPEGTALRQFNPHNEAAVSIQVEKMQANVQLGVQYLLVSMLAANGAAEYVGLGKISPSRASLLQKLRLTRPHMYIGDVAARHAEDRQGRRVRGIGSSCLHAATTYAGYGDRVAATLDAFAVNASTNQWFSRLGFVSQDQRVCGTYTLGGFNLQQVRMSTKGYATLRGIRGTLEKKYPWLADAIPISSDELPNTYTRSSST